MAQDNWWSNDPVVSQTGPKPGAPLPSPPKDVKPDKPDAPPSGYRWGPNGTLIAIPGGPADKPEKVDPADNKIGALDSVVGQINRVQELYDAGIRDETFSNAFGLLDNVGPAAGQFNSAGAGLGDQGMAAFKVPGAGPQSDADAARFVMANQPTAGDWDAAIEEKLRTLRARVDANRAAMGLPPAKWVGNSATPAEEKKGDDTPPPLLNMPAGGGDGGVTNFAAPQGGMRAVPDPTLANELFAMLKAGRSLNEISTYAQSKGAAPIVPNQEALDYARKNPGWNPFSATRFEPVTAFERAVTPSGGNGALEQVRDAAVGYATGAGQFLSGNTLDNLQRDPEQARLAMQIGSEVAPTATAVGNVSGGVLGSLAGEAMLARAGMAPGVMRSFLTDTAMGAANGAGAADAPGDSRVVGGVLGGGTAAVGNVAGGLVGKVINRGARGVTEPNTRAMIDNVGDLTIGQTYGQSGRVGSAVRGIEDRLSGLPIVGDAVNEARSRTYQNFNAKAFDTALAPIGQKLDGQVGADAVEAAQAKVQQAFKDALDGRQVQADADFGKDIAQAAAKALGIKRVGPELAENIADILGPHMQAGKTALTGEEMQMISQELSGLKAGYKASEPAFYKRIASAIDDTENAVFGMFKRQAPDVVPKYNAAKTAYRRLSILADATLKGKNQPDSMFTPAQLNAADAANAVKYEGKINAAGGERQFREFGEAAQAVLPNKVPDSGTAGRLLATGAGIGGAIGLGNSATGGDPVNGPSAGDIVGGGAGGAGTGLALSALLVGAYSKAGQRLLTKPGRGSQRLADPRLQRLLGRLGAATGAASLLGTTPSQ